jgi:RHS repeat-associated protein
VAVRFLQTRTRLFGLLLTTVVLGGFPVVPPAIALEAVQSPRPPAPEDTAPMPVPESTGVYMEPPVDAADPGDYHPAEVAAPDPGLATPTPPPPVPASGPAEAPPDEEIPGRRTRESKTFATGRADQFVTHAYSGVVHHQDHQGRWLDIDTSLIELGNRRFHARSTSARLDVAPVANDPVLGQLDLGGGDSIAWSMLGAPATPPYVDGDKATYFNVARDTDVVLTARNDGVKEDLVLRSKAAPDTFTFPLKLTGVQASLDDAGGIVYTDRSGTTKAYTPPGFMQDSSFTRSGSAKTSTGVKYALQERGGTVLLRVVLDRKWLDDPDRNYPVTVDPSTFWNSTTWSDDTYFQNTIRNNSLDIELKVGRNVDTLTEAVSYMHFDVGGLDGKTIDSAVFHAWNRWSPSCDARGMGVYPINTATNWAGSNTNLGYLPLHGRIAWAAYAMGRAGCPAGWASYHDTGIRDTVHNWTHGIWNDFGLALKVDPGSETDAMAWKQFNSWQATGGGVGVVPSAGTPVQGIPQIHIMWSEPGAVAPTSLTPANGSTYASAAPTSASAVYNDPYGRAGTVNFRLRSGGAGGPITGESGPLSATPGATKVWTLPALGNGTWAIEAVASNIGGTAAAGPNTFTVGVPPQVTKRVGTINPDGTVNCAVSNTQAVWGRGQRIPYCVVVTNPLGVQMTITKIEDILPVGVTNQATGSLLGVVPTFNGSPCTTCTWDPTNPRKLTVGQFNLNAGTSATLLLDTIAMGDNRACSTWGNVATAWTGTLSANSTTVNVTICETRLGHEKWWTYVSRDLGSMGTADVNVANGNLVVSQPDSEPVQARGRLALGLRRTYNSQDATLLTLPGSLGAGWTFNVSEVDDLVGDGISASGLVVPAIESVLKPASVTLVDRDGTRHSFSPKSANVSVTATAALPPIEPTSLVAAANSTLCVDKPYAAPPGVHLALWRYIQVTATGPGACGTVGTNPSVTIGYATMRTDRLRSEFSSTGHLLSMTDGSGAQLRYVYAAQPIAGVALGNLQAIFDGSCRTPGGTVPTTVAEVPATCRAIRFSYPSGLEVQALDSGHAVPTRYIQSVVGTKNLLTQVVNPDGSTLSYAYGGCGGTPTQLCSATDARAKTTSFTYQSASLHGQPSGSLPVLRTITDRRSAVTTFTYTSTTGRADQGTHRQRFMTIDSSGRVGEVREGGTDDVVMRQTVNTWDTASVPCQLPTPAVMDNNLCAVDRRQLPFGSASENTAFVYSKEGDVLRQTRAVDATATAVTTYGSRVQYVSGSASTCLAHVPAGTGQVQSNPSGSGCSATGPTDSTLFAIRDSTHALTPRGNSSANASSYADYMTTFIVDNASGLPNRTVAASCGAAPAANTGNLCEVRAPAFDATNAKTTTRHSYGELGQKVSMTTPKAIAEGLPGSYAYTYYGANDVDLSGTVSSAGWLKAVTDPTGNFVAFAYDRAGHVARTWDRNATSGLSVGAAWGSELLPPSTKYTETRYGPAPNAPVGATAFSAPWRFLLSSRDPMGNLTTFDADNDGNAESIRPPRGNQAGNGSFDVSMTYDNAGNITSRTLPIGSTDGTVPGTTAWAYDAFDNLSKTTDANGKITEYRYDNVSRRTTTRWTRSGSSADATAVCPFVASDPVLGSAVVCTTTTAYNSLDDVTSVQDANGKNTTFAYDRLHRMTRSNPLRNHDGLTALRSEQVYDLDGNVERICPPRQFSEGLSTSCASATNGQYAIHQAWNVAGRTSSVTTYRGATPQIESFQYDADGNVTATTDAEQHVTTATFDLLDRRLTESVPRSAGVWNVTTRHYDPSGNATAVVRPSGEDGVPRITAYSYDDSNQMVDAVEGADNVDADAAGLPSADGGQNTRTRRVYDADGRIAAVYGPRAFEPYGIVVDPRPAPNEAFKTRVEYDAAGRPVAQFVPRYDTATVTTLGPSGTQASQCPTGALGYPATAGVCVTRAQYDAVGNHSRIDLPTIADDARRFVTFAYTRDNLLQKVFTPSPADDAARVAAMSYTYDGAGRQTTQVNAMNAGTTTNYTDDGLPKDITDSLLHKTEYTYDADGNLKTTKDPSLKVSTSTYTTDGLLNSAADPLANTTAYAYDKVGNPVSVVAPSGATTTNAYTWDDLLLTSTEPVDIPSSTNRRTSYAYDAGGRRTKQQTVTLVGAAAPPAMSCTGSAWTQCVSYYRNDRVKDDIGRSGESIGTTYDAAGNKTQIVDSTNPAATVSASYYLDDRVRSVGDGGEFSSFSYDGAGRQAASVQGLVAGVGKATQYRYNNAGMQQAIGSEAVFSSSDPATAASWTSSYDAAGRLVAETARNGVTVSNCWNADDTLKTHVVKMGGSSSANCPTTDSGILAHWAFAHDPNGRVTEQVLSQAVGANGGTVTVGGSYGYGYDDAGRLDSFTDENGTRTRTIQWDADSNRTDFGIAGEFQPTHWDYNADDTIKQGPGANTGRLDFVYDNAGRLVDDGCMSYGYDGFDRLVQSDSLRNPGDPSRQNCKAEGTRFTYDGLDRQRSHAVVPATGPTLATGAHFSGLSSSLVSVDATGATLPAHLYALDADGVSKAVSELLTVAPQYLHDDGTGSVTTVTNAAGGVGCNTRFDPFGTAQKVGPDDTWSPASPGRQDACNTGTTASQVFYRGARHDVGSGTYQFGSRTYDPRKSAFLTPDSYRGPASAAGLSVGTDPLTRNSYTYVNGDPVNLIDPDGHISCPDGYCNWTANPNRKEYFQSAKSDTQLNTRVQYLIRTGKHLPDQWHSWGSEQKKAWIGKNETNVKLSPGAFDPKSMGEDALKGGTNGVAGIVNAVAATATLGKVHVDPVFNEERYKASYSVGVVGGYTAAAIGAYGLTTVGTTLGNVGTRAYVMVQSRIVQATATVGAAGQRVYDRTRQVVGNVFNRGQANASTAPRALPRSSLPSPSEAANLVRGANPVGSALKSDVYHRSATWAVDDIASNGSVYRFVGNDGVQRTLIQAPGGLNGIAGRFEWIVDGAGNLIHQMFVKGGSINGVPIAP